MSYTKKLTFPPPHFTKWQYEILAKVKLEERIYKQGRNRNVYGFVLYFYYCGSFVYENGVLKYIIFSEGNYVVGDNNYEYHIKDHLGNVRVAFFDNDTIVQRNDYYPLA